MKRLLAAAAASLVLPAALLLPASSASAAPGPVVDPAPSGPVAESDDSMLRFKNTPQMRRLIEQNRRSVSAAGEVVEPPAPVPASILTPAEGADVAGYFTVEVGRGSATNLSLWVDGVYSGVDSGTEATVSFSTYLVGPAEGQDHVLQVGDCPTASCATAAEGTVDQTITVTAYPELMVDVTSASSGYVSPNADGVRDSVTVAYTIAAAGPVTATVTRVSDAAVVRTVALGARPAGAGSFVWNGKNDAGTVVADGRYLVHLSTATSGGSAASDGVEVIVDTKAPSFSKPAKSDTKVFPRKDSYRDSVTFSAKLSERVTSVSLKVTSSKGKTVRTLSAKNVSGTVKLTWNGRTASGKIPAAGTYTYRWTATDLAGNKRTSASGSIKVDTRILKKKVRTKTVTPISSTFVSFIGDCSRVVKKPNGWSGAHGYRSLIKVLQGKSCSGLDDENSGTDDAWVRYRFDVPKAVRYGSVKVGAKGKGHPFTYRGETYKGYGGLYLIGFDGDTSAVIASSANLKPTYKTYWTGSRSFKSLRWGRTVLWDAGTDNGWQYDIRSFKVKWSYYVLVK